MRRMHMTKQEDPLDESITVARTATCETLTRKSKLTYPRKCIGWDKCA